jgi:hypothetical protein
MFAQTHQRPGPDWDGGSFCLRSLPCFFYGILWQNAVNLPIAADDYHVILDLTNKWTQLHGFLPKLLHILTFQHNEYKLILANCIVISQYVLLGHIEFYSLVALGNAFVLLIFLLLLWMQRKQTAHAGGRLLLALPLSLLLFQLQYATTLDWAMGALQNLTVIFFSLLSITLLSRSFRGSFGLACIALLLAIASSGNGFITVITGVLLLLQQRRWRELAVWTVTTVAISALYFYRYDFHSSQSIPGENVKRTFLHFNLLYGLSFLGSSVARFQSYMPSIGFGILLCGVLLMAFRTRYYQRNPAVFYAIIFVFITAIGVSGLRSELGIVQSLASRYRIYSNLLLILTYLFLSETYLAEDVRKASWKRPVLLVTVCVCGVFCAVSDWAGKHFLSDRREVVVHEMTAWERPGAHSSGAPTAANMNPVLRRQLESGQYKPNSAVLLESIRLGVYRPDLEAIR